MNDHRRTNNHLSPATTGQYERVLWLHEQILAGHCPSMAHLQEKFGISRRAAANDVARLRDYFQAPLHFSRSRGGYTYTDSTFALPQIFLSEGELLAVVLARHLAGTYAGTHLGSAVHSALKKLAVHLPEQARVSIQEVEASIRFGLPVALDVSPELFWGLKQACTDRRAVRLRYYSPRRHEETDRVVEPHYLRDAAGDWMLVAWDRLRGDDRVFSLARIREWELLDERFARRPELEPDAYDRDILRTERGEEPYQLVLRFTPYQSRWIRERRFHHSQTLEELSDGGLRLSLTVSGVTDVIRWVLQYGAEVEVESPEFIRRQVASELRRAAQRYEGAPAD